MYKKAFCALKSFMLYHQFGALKNLNQIMEIWWLKHKWKEHLGGAQRLLSTVKMVEGVVTKKLQILTYRKVIQKIASLCPSLTITAALLLAKETLIFQFNYQFST